jgi:hypothetical protein
MDWQNQNGNPYPNGNPYNDNNPYQNNNGWQYRSVPPKAKGDGLATAALILGVMSILSLFFMQLYIPFIAGGIGIILAILSKGSARKLSGKAKAGITGCTVGLLLDVLLCVGSVYLVFNLPKIMPDMVDEVSEMCEERYGMSYEELMDELNDMIQGTDIE